MCWLRRLWWPAPTKAAANALADSWRSRATGSLEARQVVRTGPFDDFGAHSYQHFAITDDAVTFFFGHDILHQGGPQKASVLRTELASLLA